MWLTQIKLIDWVFLTLVAAASFFVSGLPYYPFLNSDIAVHILMAESFSFKFDLFYWNQDRLGSLVPMTANIIYRFTSLSPFWLVAIVKWFYLLIGCAALWYFIPNRIQRWLWSCLWFFPAYEMMYHLLPGHPYAEQMAMFGMSLIFFDRWVKNPQSHWYLLPTILFAVLSIWVSDFSALFYLVLFIHFFKPILNKLKDLFRRRNQFIIIFLFALTTILIGFMVYAKQTAARDETYITAMFANVDQLQHSIELMWFYLTYTLLFKSVTIWNSVFFFASVFLVVMLSIRPTQFKQCTYTPYFIGLAIFGFLLLLSLRWVSINYVMLKYFIPVFFCFWLGLFSVNWQSPRNSFTWLTTSLGVILVIGCAASLLTLYNTEVERKITYQDLNTPFYSSQKYILGDYWHSYVFTIASPSIVKASPHDQSNVRSIKQAQIVVNSDTIYVCLDNWLDKAPNTLVQFGKEMTLIEPNIQEGDFHFAVYKTVEND